jgi:hypothetical protein
MKAKKPTNSTMFAEAIKECYSKYKKKFPIRILPEELNESDLNAACSKFHDEFKEHVKSGKYKD